MADSAAAAHAPREARAPERVLIVRLSHLGDVVHALPVFHELRALYPRARIGWAVQREFAGLLDGLPGLDALLPFDRRGGLAAWLDLRARARAFAPELIVDAQGNLKSASVSWAAGAGRRVGLARADWREPLGARVLHECAPPTRAVAGQPVHALERMQQLAAWLARRAGAEPGPPRFDPALSALELAAGRAALAERRPAGAAPWVLVHLSTPGDVRSWPAERYAELAEQLARLELPALFLSGPAEAELGARLARSIGAHGGARHWVGQRGLRMLAAVFAAAAESGARLVACDSGPAHLATSVGLPVALLHGPQDPARTGPWPRPPAAPHLWISAEAPPACAPCRARTCHHPQGPVCMRGIGARALAERLAQALPRAGAPDTLTGSKVAR